MNIQKHGDIYSMDSPTFKLLLLAAYAGACSHNYAECNCGGCMNRLSEAVANLNNFDPIALLELIGGELNNHLSGTKKSLELPMIIGAYPKLGMGLEMQVNKELS